MDISSKDFLNVDLWEDKEAGYTISRHFSNKGLESSTITYTLAFSDAESWKGFSMLYKQYDGRVCLSDHFMVLNTLISVKMSDDGEYSKSATFNAKLI